MRGITLSDIDDAIARMEVREPTRHNVNMQTEHLVGHWIAPWYEEQYPLMDRYLLHVRGAGLGKNQQPWQALGSRLHMLGALLHVWRNPEVFTSFPYSGGEDQEVDQEADQFFKEQIPARCLALVKSEVYQWVDRIHVLVEEAELPQHVISPEVMPSPLLYWSFDSPVALHKDLITQCLLFEGGEGLTFLFADYERSNAEALTFGEAFIRYGATYPDDFTEDPFQLSKVRFVLQHLAFLNSPYSEQVCSGLPRAVRRDLQRKNPNFDEDANQVRTVLLRQVRDRQGATREHGTVEWHHHWRVRAHNRAQWYPSEKAHHVIYIPEQIRGDRSKPFLSKMYRVAR